jgi:hypothetical protein
MIFAIFGASTVEVAEEENVMLSGVSLFGGGSMRPHLYVVRTFWTSRQRI